MSFSSSLSAPDYPVSKTAARVRRSWSYGHRVFEKSIAIILFLLAWELAPRLGVINRGFLPPLSEIFTHGYEYAATGKLGPHILVSLERALSGFALGVVLGGPLGILLGWYRGFDRYLNPLLQLLRQFSAISLLPVFILFFGVGSATRLTIIFWVVLWPILLNTSSGVRYVDPALVKYGRSLALPDWQILLKIAVPSAIPSFFAGIRLSVTYAILVLAFAEQVGASSGLGYLLANAQYLVGIHLLYVAVILLALMGFGANFALVKLERRLTAWKPDPTGLPNR